MTHDEIFMQRCIQLAGNGRNNVSPNPMVGAVIVCDGLIIGEGYHICYGDSHAEVNAVRSVRNPELLKRSTIYVTLEPCFHHGKTPPCVDLILEKGITRIVVGCIDPFAKVAGRSVKKLRDAGRDVTVGVLENECRNLIRNFIVHQTMHRPYIVLKWAESADGFLDLTRTGGSPVQLSTDLTSMLVHRKRSLADAIMVGTQTALLDNPSLTVRNWSGRHPVRVVLDKYLALPVSLSLFDGRVPTLVYTIKSRQNATNLEFITLDSDSWLLPQIMNDLRSRGIQNLLVEGGSKLLQSFLDDTLWDEIYLEKSSIMLYSGVKAPEIRDKKSYTAEQYFGQYILHYVNENP